MCKTSDLVECPQSLLKPKISTLPPTQIQHNRPSHVVIVTQASTDRKTRETPIEDMQSITRQR